MSASPWATRNLVVAPIAMFIDSKEPMLLSGRAQPDRQAIPPCNNSTVRERKEILHCSYSTVRERKEILHCSNSTVRENQRISMRINLEVLSSFDFIITTSTRYK